MSPKQFIQPPGMYSHAGYTQVVAAQGGTLIFLSGQVAYDVQGQIVGAHDLRAQARRCFENLKTALAGAGATIADVVKLTIYVVNYQPEYRGAIVEVRDEFVNSEHPPASTWIGVQSLARPEFMIEVEAIAIIG